MTDLTGSPESLRVALSNKNAFVDRYDRLDMVSLRLRNETSHLVHDLPKVPFFGVSAA